MYNRKTYYKRIEKENHKKAPWKRIFKSIKARCENPNNQDYHRYGRRGIKCLITEKEVMYLWNLCKAFEMNQPTIDRIDNNGDYTFYNCQFLENVINVKKAQNEPILQFDLQGNLIKEWCSQSEASRQLKISQGNIGSCTRKERYSAGGFVWKKKIVTP